MFRTLLPDNTKTIVHTADALEPRITRAFLEYALGSCSPNPIPLHRLLSVAESGEAI